MQKNSDLNDFPARRTYGLDEISIAPSRRTRDPEDVDISWEIESYKFDLPMLGSAMDSAISPDTAITIGQLGGLGVLNLEGLWTRYEDPSLIFETIASLSGDDCTHYMQKMYQEAIKPELITERVRQMKAAGVITAASLTPARVREYYQAAQAGGLDILVIQGTVVSAEHVSKRDAPLNLKEFVRQLQIEDLAVMLGNCATYAGARHLMKTGAIGILVGVGPGEACTSRGVLGIGVPQATAIFDAVKAREKHLKETNVHCHVIADGGMSTGGDVSKAIALGADAVMIGSPLATAVDAPGQGYHWGMAAPHPSLPRGVRVKVSPRGTLREILVGPAHDNDGRLNLFGALRTAMATCGYETRQRFQDAEVIISPSIRSEGKALQQAQGVGMWK